MLAASLSLALLTAIAQTARPLTIEDAVRLAIERHPTLRLRRAAITQSLAELDRARAQFDPTLRAAAGHEHRRAPRTDDPLDISRVELALIKETSWGMIIAPALSLSRADPAEIEGVGATSALTDAALTLTQRLLKGAGSANGAAERASETLHRASELDFEHESALRVLIVALAYWSTVAATENEQIARESEARAKKLLDDTNQLVVAKERPAADLFQLRASLTERTRLRLDASRALATAKQLLQLATGASAEELDGAIDPVDRFTLSPGLRGERPALLELVRQADEHRRDLRAARLREEATRTLLGAAEHNLLPALDLSGTIGYASTDNGNTLAAVLSSPFAESPGYRAAVNLSLLWPIENALAEADLGAQRAALEQNSALIAELARTIHSEVMRAIDDFLAYAQIVEQTASAIEHYRQAADGEREKLRAGLSTVLDVVATEDRLTSAQFSHVEAVRAYASALAVLRYSSATLDPLSPELKTPPR